MKSRKPDQNAPKRLLSLMLALLLFGSVAAAEEAEDTDPYTKVWNALVDLVDYTAEKRMEQWMRWYTPATAQEGDASDSFKGSSGDDDAGQIGFEERVASPYCNPLEGSTFPEQYDLRNVDGKCYVTSVKNQGHFGTCWAFGTIAAAEISIMRTLDMPVTVDENGVSHDPIDLSERHLAWFAYMPQAEDRPQAGEGLMLFNEDFSGYSTDAVKVLSEGGRFVFADDLLKSGASLIPEEFAPYQPDEVNGVDVARLAGLMNGKDVRDGTEDDIALSQEPDYLTAAPYISYKLQTGEAMCWNTKGTWGLDDSLRYLQDYAPEAVRILPDSRYGNPRGVNAIKNELYNGHGVAVAIRSDASTSADLLEEGQARYIRTDNEDGTWGHFTYEDVTTTHIVCIVGWDDTYSADHFNADPALCPPGPGAWIVKNSWGTADSVFPDRASGGTWGNNGDGYFYISYYDHSISEAQSLIFSEKPLADETLIGEYDFMSCEGKSYKINTNDPVKTANIFYVFDHQQLNEFGVDVTLPDTTLTISVYRLNDDSKSPEDGERVAHGTVPFDYAGFYRFTLDTPQEFFPGDKYSVVVEEVYNGNPSLTLYQEMNFEGAKFLRSHYMLMSGKKSDIKFYSVGIVNPGESYVCACGYWIDFADIVAEGLKRAEERTGIKDGGIAMDNFAIRTYSTLLD